MANNTGQKFGGRKKGTPNKSTSEIRDWLTSFLENQFDNLEETFESLSDKEKLNILVKLMPYVLPKITEETFPNPTDEKKEYDLSKLDNDEVIQLNTILKKALIEPFNL